MKRVYVYFRGGEKQIFQGVDDNPITKITDSGGELTIIWEKDGLIAIFNKSVIAGYFETEEQDPNNLLDML